MRGQKTYPVTRNLKVTEMVCDECSNIIAEALQALGGVSHVQSDWQHNKVTVTYNLYQVKIQEVEKLLLEIGYPPAEGFLQKTKREWLHFREKNEMDSLKHVGHCCSKPPVGV
ncbi:MAG: heavy-metal-associated domain-containing protein [Magnetococcales bacterium]|nr:heavy-metal-associated domain-containing protein [Magnetococcales bacterium]